MPANREDRQLALDMIEWAHEDTEAMEVAPEEVEKLRGLMEGPLEDECAWREVFDLALDVWKKGHARFKRQNRAEKRRMKKALDETMDLF